MVSPAAKREKMPETQQKALKRAIILSWLTIAYLVVDIIILFLIKGNSQAMQAAWVQDLLALVPPLAFLIGTRVISRRASKRFPYGFHQAQDVAHFVSAVALLAFGGFLLLQSVMTLVAVEHPGIGLIVIFGIEIWHGWIMVAFMALGVIPPLILGRLKLGPAKLLHNKVLFTDSKMNKADWLSSVAAIAGITGVGLGIWWMDAAAAIVISLDILQDGYQNLRTSLGGLVDSTPYQLGDSKLHPLPAQLNRQLAELPWVQKAGCRVREEGQVFHIEAFVVLENPDEIPVKRLRQAREECLSLDWKIYDVTISPVEELPPLAQTDVAEP